MSAEGLANCITLKAGADLSNLQYKVINVAGTLAVSNVLAAGVLQNAPQSGEHASVKYQGHMKAYAGGSIAAGNPLIMSASGTLVVGSQSIVGKSLAAASSGALVEFIGDFSNTF